MVFESNGRAVFWRLNLESWRKEACSAAGRNLTAAEWSQAFSTTQYQTLCPGLPTPLDVLALNGRWSTLVNLAQAYTSTGNSRNLEEATAGVRVAASALLAASKLKKPGRIGFLSWYSACQTGTLSGTTQDVSQVCDTALSLAPSEPMVRLYHAVTRIESGRGPTAIPDLEFLVAHPRAGLDTKLVQGWLEDLRNGKDIRAPVRKALARL